MAYTKRTAELLIQLGLTRDSDGNFDTSKIDLHLDPNRLSEPILIHGSVKLPIEMLDLMQCLGAHLPRRLAEVEDSNRISRFIFAGNGYTAAYWSGADGVCLFENLAPRIIEVFRTFANSSLSSDDRREAHISVRETVLQVSALFGCCGPHKRPCPPEGDRARSVVRDDGSVDVALLRKLRD